MGGADMRLAVTSISVNIFLSQDKPNGVLSKFESKPCRRSFDNILHKPNFSTYFIMSHDLTFILKQSICSSHFIVLLNKLIMLTDKVFVLTFYLVLIMLLFSEVHIFKSESVTVNYLTKNRKQLLSCS